jgi:hypothetical protein
MLIGFCDMKVGDIVIARDGNTLNKLFSGAECFTHAICVSVEPFILISEDASMRWSAKDVDDFVGLTRAHPEVFEHCMERLEYDIKSGQIEDPRPKKVSFVAYSKANKSWCGQDRDILGAIVNENRGHDYRPRYKNEKIAKSKIPSHKRDDEWEWEIHEYHGDELVTVTPVTFSKKRPFTK